MDPDTQHTKPEEDIQKRETGETVVPTRAQGVSKYTPPSDPSRYIRTYAKDVATATHAEAPAVAPPVQSQQLQSDPARPAMQSTGIDGVSLPEYDASPIDHGGDPSSPKEFEQEKVVLRGSDSDDIFSKPESVPDRESVLARLREKVGGGTHGITLAPTSLRAPIQDVAPSGLIQTDVPVAAAPPVPEPQLPVQSTAPAEPLPQQETQPEFSSTQTYLPSLAEQIAQLPPLPGAAAVQTSTPPIAAVPSFTPLAPDNLPGQYTPPEFIAAQPAPPVFVSPTIEPAPVISATPEISVPQSIPEPIVQEQLYTPPVRQAPQNGVLSPIHTYSSDFSQQIDQKGSSTFSVLAAQSDAGQTPRAATPPKKKSLIPLTIGIALLIVGAGILGGAYYYATSSNNVPVVAGVPSLITFDESVELSGIGPALVQSLADTSQGGSVSGNVVVTYTTTTANGDSTNTPQPGGALIRAMALPAPDILLRNIDPSSTVGFIRAGTESRSFFLLKVSSYERTFAGMLAWERTIGFDLATLYPAYSENVIETITASSTEPFVVPTPAGFVDAIVDNYDVRILRDSSGRSILLYGYHGKDMLIVARDEAAFSALISRLSATKN